MNWPHHRSSSFGPALVILHELVAAIIHAKQQNQILSCHKILIYCLPLFFFLKKGPKGRGNGRFKLVTSTLWAVVPSQLCVSFSVIFIHWEFRGSNTSLKSYIFMLWQVNFIRTEPRWHHSKNRREKSQGQTKNKNKGAMKIKHIENLEILMKFKRPIYILDKSRTSLGQHKNEKGLWSTFLSSTFGGGPSW